MRKCRKKISHQNLLSLAKNSETAEKDNCAIVCRLVNPRTWKEENLPSKSTVSCKEFQEPQKRLFHQVWGQCFSFNIRSHWCRTAGKDSRAAIIQGSTWCIYSQISRRITVTWPLWKARIPKHAGMFMPNGVVLAETDDNSFGSQCVIFTGFWIRPLQAKFSFRIELNKFQSLFRCRMIECPWLS